MNHHWWRAYNTAANDPKLGGLTDWQHRCWFQLMCMASEGGGTLPPLKHIAFTLRCREDKAAEVLTQLHAAGLLDQTETGFAPHNWNGRQYKSDVSTERVKRFRNAKRNVSPNEGCNAPEQSRTEQSRAEQTASVAFEEIGKVKAYLTEAFSGAPPPDLDRAVGWLAKGYSAGMIGDVVREVLGRGTAVGSLAYFETILEQRHAKRPLSPSERAAVPVDFDKVAEFFKKTGTWSKHAGPEPGMLGCKCPAEILAKHGIVTRRMDA